MIDGKKFFHQPINSNLKTYENIRKIAIGKEDDYTTGCLLDYSFFDKKYKIIATDLSKQQVREADPSVIQQINFTTNRTRGATIFCIIKEGNETFRTFHKEL